jgi:hypothetical protein
MITRLVVVLRGTTNEFIGRDVYPGTEGNRCGQLKLRALELRPAVLLAREKLSPLQERNVMGLASGCYRFLDDFKAALPLAQRRVVLEQELAGPRSLRHAQALQSCARCRVG